VDRHTPTPTSTTPSAVTSGPAQARPARRRRALAPLLGMALALAACGGGDDGLPEADLVAVGTDVLTWEPDRLETTAGTRSVAIVCQPGANHNLVIEETGEEVVACTPGRTAFGEVTLEAGTYVYVCTVPGHEVTMRGVLEVR